MKMMKEIDRKHSWRKLSPDDGHFFFGYYDRNPWDGEIRRHLVLKIPQIDRLPERGERAEIGLLDRAGQCPAPLRPLCAVGSRTLLVYMLHQPVIYGLLFLADAALG